MPPYIAPEQGDRVGVWGSPTSTLDWCEENHVLSYYIAEFWNTVSNAAMIVPALWGLWKCYSNHLETRYYLCYIGLLAVGVGSLLFHGTLLYTMQLLDELPMLILSACMLFTLYEMGQPRGVYPTSTYIRTVLLMAYTTIVILVYLIIPDPVFFEGAYAVMVLGLVVHGFYSISKYSGSRLVPMALGSMAVYGFGFVLWNIDNHFCPKLREYRSSSHIFAPLTQLHAWWHIFAGAGTYLHVLLSSRLRMQTLKHHCSIKYFFGMPYLEVSKIKN
ncbi:alkaline ceramidase 3-like [Halichondria panicea]|uniref:alkaline ceramidase 3-like n=1 Tax=Halichondria panicea TaxID=6063 RepID=UPI00312B8639